MDPTLQPREYWCFISYRHADNKEPGRQWASWLHHTLETYEVPADLVGQKNSRGDTIPERIYPVFRDEEELPADSHLSAPIERALRHSKFLVVLCSPRAVESRFVAEEILGFKAHRPENKDRILAAIIAGEPGGEEVTLADSATSPIPYANRQCFPRPLRFEAAPDGTLTGTPAEPIAADFRLRDGAESYTSPAAYREQSASGGAAILPATIAEFEKRQELMKLKIIAGILGVPLGTLTARDKAYQLAKAQQRARVLRRWLTVVGLLMALALAAGLIAWQQRNLAKSNEQTAREKEAQAQQAKAKAVAAKKSADDLISFMQYDLRDTLGKVGRLDMMKSINERIASYHADHPPEEGDADALRENGAMASQTGDILFGQGDLKGALEQYRKCHQIAERLAKQDPGNTKWQRDLSVIYNKVGDVLGESGDRKGALESYQQSLAIRERLAKQDPGDADWQRDLSVSYERVGNVLGESGDGKGALESYLQSLAIAERLAKQDPGNADWQRDLCVSYDRVGEARSANGDLKGALESYEKSLAIAERLAKQDPGNAQWQHDLSFSYQRVGDMQSAGGDGARALKSYQKSLAIRERLAKQDPANAQWQRDLSSSYYLLSETLEMLKDLPGAVEKAEASLKIDEKLAILAQANSTWKDDVSKGRARVARLRAAVEAQRKK